MEGNFHPVFFATPLPPMRKSRPAPRKKQGYAEEEAAFFRHLLIAAARRNFGRPEVRRKDYDAFAEIHRLALAIGQSAVLQYL